MSRFSSRSSRYTSLALALAAMGLAYYGWQLTHQPELPDSTLSENAAQAASTTSVEVPQVSLTEALTLGKKAMADKQWPMAEGYYAQVLKRLKATDADYRDTLKNLAYSHYKQGHLAQAKGFYQTLLEHDQSQASNQDEKISYDLKQLANLAYHLKDYQTAESHYQQAMLLDENVLGAENPETITTLNNLALVYEAQNKQLEAETLYKRALQIAESTPDSPNKRQLLVLALANLSGLYIDQSDYIEAGYLLNRSVLLIDGEPDRPKARPAGKKPYKTQKQKKAYFDQLAAKAPTFYTPAVFATFTNLAEVYRQQQNYDMAELCYRRALLVSEKTLSPGDANYKALHENLASLYKEMGDEDKANDYAARARALDTPNAEPLRKETLSQATSPARS